MPQDARVFNGRYEIVRPLARGGMADVYLARDQLLDRPVALKVLFPELSVDKSFVERFRREAQAAANLSHPNVVSVYDFGEENGTSFIVMEYIDGRTLTEVIRNEGPLPADKAAAVGAHVAAALGFAHRNGVVHRDVKPGNVLIDVEGHVKVTDFGIARAANTQENLTQTGAVMGTATYFSPEQAEGSAVDARSDVYSLGVVLYEMVTGRPPFTGDNPVSIAYKHVREEPASPRSLNPALPIEFETIVIQAMAKDRDVRYQSADDLRADLIRFRQGRPIIASAATTMVPATATTAVPAAGGMTQAVSALPPPKNRTGTYIVILLAMLALLGLLLFAFAKTLRGPASAKQVEVPAVIGQKADDAEATLRDRGFVVKRGTEFNTADANTVFKQDPAGGTKVSKGGTVTISVSQGKQPVTVPNVVGDDATDASDRLRAAGFVVNRRDQTDLQAATNRVLTQEPRGGTTAGEGSTVTITVSSGKPKVQVPNEAGKDQATAFDEIQAAGLRVKSASEASSSVAQGKVIRTDPAAGTTVDQGSTVTVFVSNGPQQTEVPDVIGKTEDEAKAALNAAGFQVKVKIQTVTSDADDGRVLAQDPSSGTKAANGSTVTITVGKKPTPP